jgi:membrane protein implicated in regulation of membrane protease activity
VSDLMRTLRKLVLGETWALPIGVAVAVGAAGVLSALAGSHGWWHDGGGFVLLALVLLALLAAVGRPRGGA